MSVSLHNSIRSRQSRGIALIITLVMIVLLSFLIFGFVASMRIEREVATSFGEEVEGRWLAEAALADALACLASSTPPVSVSRTWAAGPGAAYWVDGGGIVTARLYSVETVIDSEKTNLYDNALSQNNLNNNALICGVNSRYANPSFDTNVDWNNTSVVTKAGLYITPTNTFITPGWVRIGTNFQTAGASGGFTNQIVGRYAYWIDAESCKVNVNTAGMRDVTASATSNPSDVDLRALYAPFLNTAAATVNSFMGNRPFTTLEETRIQGAGGNWPWQQPAGFDSNKFFMTVSSVDANTDVFGRDRINIAGLQIGSGAYSNIMSRCGETFYADIVYPDQITDVSRNSFQKKYGLFGVSQIVANLIDYQRPAGSTPTVSALGSGAVSDDNFGIPSYYCGLIKGPLISEILVHASTNFPASGIASNVDVLVSINVKLVNGYFGAGTRGAGWIVRGIPQSVVVAGLDGATPVSYTHNFTVEDTATFTSGVAANSFGLMSSQSRPLLFTVPFNSAAGNSMTVTSVVVNLKRIRLLMSPSSDNSIVDWMTRSDFSAAYGSGMVFTGQMIASTDLLATAYATPSSVAFRPNAIGKQDPRVRTFPGWKGDAAAFANGASTGSASFETNWFGYANSQVNPTADDNCSSQFTSLITPRLYGMLANVRGCDTFLGTPNTQAPTHRYLDSRIREATITSVGELAYIHTGYPWRTIRFAPVRPFLTNSTVSVEAGPATARVNNLFVADKPVDTATGLGDPNFISSGAWDHRGVEQAAIPDWTMLDMFKVGNETVVPGRININNRFTGPAAQFPARVEPIQALLRDTLNVADLFISSNSAMQVTFQSPVANVVALDWVARNVVVGLCVPDSPYGKVTSLGDNRMGPYLTPGQICEVPGLHAQYQKLGLTRNPTAAERAQIIARIANLITTRSDTFTLWVVAESVQDLDRDGRFDWVYEQQWRYLPSQFPPPNVKTNWWQSNVVNNAFLVSAMADGDGDGDKRLDRVKSRYRIQATVQRYVDTDGKSKYRVLYTRFHPG